MIVIIQEENVKIKEKLATLEERNRSNLIHCKFKAILNTIFLAMAGLAGGGIFLSDNFTFNTVGIVFAVITLVFLILAIGTTWSD